MKRFTPTEDRYIKKNYLKIPIATLERMMNRAKGTVRQRLPLIGLVVPEELRRKFKTQSCFNKGHEPVNKGKKRSEWMSKSGIARCKKTQYKKGQLPYHTHKPFDIVEWKKEGEKPYLVMYLNPKKRIYLQRYIWEQAYGPIPKGYKICFKDGNTLNCNLSNLEKVSDAELMVRNSAQRFGPELVKIIQLRGALNRQINKRLKQIK